MEAKSKKVDRLMKTAMGSKNALIMPHNYADPDAIAASVAIKAIFWEKLSLPSIIAFDGAVGREENRVLCETLSIETSPAKDIDPDLYDLIVLVDCQPGSGNNALPEGRKPDIIIDHHPAEVDRRNFTFADIRDDVGSSSTIAAEYLFDSGTSINSDIATALIYGIKTDSLNMAIKTKVKDLEAYLHLFPLANMEKLNMIESAQLPGEYFSALKGAIEEAGIYGNIIVSDLKDVDNPGLVGEFADLFLRLDSVDTSLCFGVHDEKMLVSIRTNDRGIDAGKIIKFAVGERGTAGGHAAMAGGQIPLLKETKKEKLDHIKAIRDKVFSRLSIEEKRKVRFD